MDKDYAVTAFHCKPYMAPGSTCLGIVLAHAFQRFERCPSCNTRFRLTWVSGEETIISHGVAKLITVEREVSENVYERYKEERAKCMTI